MAQVAVSNNTSYSTITYTGFKGVDFNPDITKISRQRSPDGLNMISDDGGQPIKRHGWEKVAQLGGTINGKELKPEVKKLYPYTYAGKSYIVAQLEDSLSWINLETNEVRHIYTENGSYFLPIPTSDGMRFFEMEKVEHHSGTATEIHVYSMKDWDRGITQPTSEIKVPTVIVYASPDGAGTSYEPVNLLSDHCKITYVCDGTSTEYYLPANAQTGYGATIEREYYDSGELKTYIYSSSEFSFGESGGRQYVKFNEAPPKPDANQTANLTITYRVKYDLFKPETILKAEYMYTYSEGTSSRYFAIADDSNLVYYSELDDYLNWPDTNYMNVGSPDSYCKGMLSIGNNIAVIKDQSDVEGALFFISPTTVTDSILTADASGNTTTEQLVRYIYKVEPAVAGIGAINSTTFATLVDEPLFLSTQGIIGIASSTTVSQKALQNRSYFLNSRLTKESNLENAIACSHKGYYILVVNDHAYILDSRQKTSGYSSNTNFAYDGYYWNNIPATAICSYHDSLYFGTKDGYLCKFGNGYTDDGKVFKCVWSTPDDADSAPQYIKTMQRKGSSMLCKEYGSSEADIYAIQDEKKKVYVGHATTTGGIVDFEKVDLKNDDIDKSKIEYFMGKKLKKYHRLKIIVESTNDKPFGLYQITKTFNTVKYAKK